MEMHTYTNELLGKTIFAADGTIGKLKDLYFEDRHWRVKYLAIALDSWLFNDIILISPSELALFLDEKGELNTQLSRAQLKEKATQDSPMPISRPNTSKLYNYRSWPSFGRAGNGYPTLGMFKAGSGLVNNAEVLVKKEVHLLRFRDVVDYELCNETERLGLVKDLVINFEKWSIPFLLVDDVTTSNRERVVVRSKDSTSFETHYAILRANLSRTQFDVCPRINPDGFFANYGGGI